MKTLIGRGQFSWLCNDGRIVTRQTISSTHAVNLAKMLWNHLSERNSAFEVVAKTPNGLKLYHEIDPTMASTLICLLIDTIEERGGADKLPSYSARHYLALKKAVEKLVLRTQKLREGRDENLL